MSKDMFFGGRGVGRAASLLPIILLLCLTSNSNILPVAEAIWLTIPSSGTKCVSEEIQSNVVVLADYYVIDENNPDHIPTISARVTSPFGNNLHHNENATHGQFAFTSSESGNYLACFWKDGGHQQDAELTLGIDWKIGIAAKDWESVAKKEKIEGVELVLRRLQGTVEAIHGNLIYLKDRIILACVFLKIAIIFEYVLELYSEECSYDCNENTKVTFAISFLDIYREAEMREVSETTNARVAWFSIMSLGVCIIVSALQLWYLKRYFVKKKLI